MKRERIRIQTKMMHACMEWKQEDCGWNGTETPKKPRWNGME